MFAGPNGSGKSTIKEVIPAHLLGVYLNADDIEKQIRQTGQCDLALYLKTASAQDAIHYFQASTFLLSAGLQEQIQYIKAQGHILDFSCVAINSYFSPVMFDFFSNKIHKEKLSFSF